MLPTLRKARPVRTIWDDPFESMHRELNRLFGDSGLEPAPATQRTASYPVDIREDDDHIYIDAELPGFTKDQVELTLEAGTLTISAERKAQEQNGATHLNERRFTRVYRSFTLPSSVDESKVEANLVDGVLHVQLNKREEVKPRRIEVK